MGEIGSGSGSGFPAALDSNNKLEYDKESADRTLVRADIQNDLAASIVATETELGINVAGNKTDVKTRLAISMDDDGYIGQVRYRDQFSSIQTADTDASSGGEIKMSVGTEDLDDTPYDQSDSIHLKGSGFASVVTANGSTRLIRSATGGVSGLSVTNIKLDGESPASSGNVEQHAAIKYASTDSADTVRDTIIGPNLWIVDIPGDGVELRYADRVIVHNAIIDVNWQRIGASLCGRNGVASLDGDTLIFSNLIIRRAATSGIDLEPALASEAIKRVVISNCIIEDCLNGITVNSTVGGLGDIDYISISDCTFKVGDNSATGFNTGTTGIWLKYAKNVAISNCVIHGQDTLSKSGTGIYIQYSDNINISNCIIKGCADGVKISNTTTAPTNELQINNCKISGCYQSGIYAVNGSGNTGDRCTISGCHVFNNSQISVGTWQGIMVRYFDYVNVSNCHGYDDQGTHTQKTGIHVQDATGAIVLGNFADGNTASQIRLITASITNLEYGHNVGVVAFV